MGAVGEVKRGGGEEGRGAKRKYSSKQTNKLTKIFKSDAITLSLLF